MSLLTTQTTYGVGGKKEQFDKLFPQGDRKTPVLDKLPGHENVEADRVDWDTETIGAVDLNNAQSEAADYTYAGANVTVKLFNQIQQSTKGWSLSKKASKINYAGRKSELQRQQKIKALELRRDLEGMILQTTAAPVVGENTTPTASAAAGIPYYIINKGGVNVDNTSATLLEADVREALAGIAANGGGIDGNYIMVCTYAIADTLVDWASVTDSIVSVDMGTGKFTRRLLTYSSNSGTVTVVPTALIDSAQVLVLDTQTWGVGFLGNPMDHIWKDKPDGKSGQASASAFRGTFETHWTLVAKNPTVNARIVIT